jgi:hypothetical protein
LEEIAIEELTRIFIQEDFDERKNNTEYYKVSKKDLISLCIKLVKLMERVKNER